MNETAEFRRPPPHSSPGALCLRIRLSVWCSHRAARGPGTALRTVKSYQASSLCPPLTGIAPELGECLPAAVSECPPAVVTECPPVAVSECPPAVLYFKADQLYLIELAWCYGFLCDMYTGPEAGGIAHLQSQGEGEAANPHRPVPQGFEPWTSGFVVQHCCDRVSASCCVRVSACCFDRVSAGCCSSVGPRSRTGNRRWRQLKSAVSLTGRTDAPRFRPETETEAEAEAEAEAETESEKREPETETSCTTYSYVTGGQLRTAERQNSDGPGAAV